MAKKTASRSKSARPTKKKTGRPHTSATRAKKTASRAAASKAGSKKSTAKKPAPKKAVAKKTTRKSPAKRPAAKKGAGGKMVYSFGKIKTEGDTSMKMLIGGKGANLAEMTSIGLPVPPGFTITTEVCTHVYRHGGRFPKTLEREVERFLNELPEQPVQ